MYSIFLPNLHLLLAAFFLMLIAKWKHGDVYSDHMDDKLLIFCLSVCPHCLYMAPGVEWCIGLLVCYYFQQTNCLHHLHLCPIVSLHPWYPSLLFSRFSVPTLHLFTFEIQPAWQRQREGDSCHKERKRLLRWLDRWRAGVSSKE